MQLNKSHKLFICFLFSFLFLLIYLKKSIDEAKVAKSNSCENVKNIVFLKTHKCASSSLQNIFLRYGEKHNLNFAVPDHGHQLYDEEWNLVGMNQENMEYNIFCNHARFDLKKISDVMGDNQRSVYITMIRDPVDIFISAYDYYQLEKYYKMPLYQFAREASNVSSPLRTMRKNGRLGANLLLWDLGVDDAYDVKAVEQKILEMDNTFHMVMILEHFDESVALMRNLLCWSFLDVTSLKLNSRTVAKEDVIGKETRRLLQEIMAPDYKVYNFFKSKFLKHLRIFGQERMAEELDQVEKANDFMSETCGFIESDNSELDGPNKWWGSADLVGYKVEENQDEICQLMTMAEISYIDRIRNIQKERLRK